MIMDPWVINRVSILIPIVVIVVGVVPIPRWACCGWTRDGWTRDGWTYAGWTHRRRASSWRAHVRWTYSAWRANISRWTYAWWASRGRTDARRTSYGRLNRGRARDRWTDAARWAHGRAWFDQPRRTGTGNGTRDDRRRYTWSWTSRRGSSHGRTGAVPIRWNHHARSARGGSRVAGTWTSRSNSWHGWSSRAAHGGHALRYSSGSGSPTRRLTLCHRQGTAQRH